jgi:hypothetical protein
MDRHGYSIFCDDIRNEVGGKLSFIGCYNAVMFVSTPFPLRLPKFCIHFHIVSPASKPYSSILIRCYTPGRDGPILEEPVDIPPIEDQQELVSASDHGSAPRFIVAGGSLILAPLQIDSPGLIRVRALVDGKKDEMMLGSLKIAQLEE